MTSPNCNLIMERTARTINRLRSILIIRIKLCATGKTDGTSQERVLKLIYKKYKNYSISEKTLAMYPRWI